VAHRKHAGGTGLRAARPAISGWRVQAIVQVRLAPAASRQIFEKQLRTMPSVLCAWHVTGDVDWTKQTSATDAAPTVKHSPGQRSPTPERPSCAVPWPTGSARKACRWTCRARSGRPDNNSRSRSPVCPGRPGTGRHAGPAYRAPGVRPADRPGLHLADLADVGPGPQPALGAAQRTGPARDAHPTRRGADTARSARRPRTIPWHGSRQRAPTRTGRQHPTTAGPVRSPAPPCIASSQAPPAGPDEPARSPSAAGLTTGRYPRATLLCTLLGPGPRWVWDGAGSRHPKAKRNSPFAD
jgi:hypothetical protein